MLRARTVLGVPSSREGRELCDVDLRAWARDLRFLSGPRPVCRGWVAVVRACGKGRRRQGEWTPHWGAWRERVRLRTRSGGRDKGRRTERVCPSQRPKGLRRRRVWVVRLERWVLSQVMLVPVKCVGVVGEIECFYGYIGWLSAPFSSIIAFLIQSRNTMASEVRGRRKRVIWIWRPWASEARSWRGRFESMFREHVWVVRGRDFVIL